MIHKRIGSYLVYKLYFRESCVVVIINYLFYVQVFACLVSFCLLKIQPMHDFFLKHICI